MGTASDQYSLGVVLYELLTGWYPFQKTDRPMTKTILAERSPDGPITVWLRRAEMERAILTVEPQKPSRAVVENTGGTIEKDSQQNLTRLRRELQGDLDCIVLKALSKQPHERYSSVQCLSEDIGRYLSGHPIVPRKGSYEYRVGKFARRHVVGVTAAFLVTVAIVSAAIISLRFAQTAIIQRSKAVDRLNDARKLARFVLFDFDDAIHEGVTPARKRLVAEALGYLNRLSKHTSGDPTFEKDIIDGYLKVGDLQGNPNGPNLGDSDGAQESYNKALQLAEALRAKYPWDTRLHDELAQVNMKLGDLSEYSGNRADALKRYQHAREIVQPLASADDQAKRSLMVVSGKIGTIQLQLGDTNGALDNYGRYLQIAQELLAADRNDSHARRDAALGYEKVGETTGAISEGLQKLKMARSIYEELAASGPQSPARRDLAIVATVIGDLLKTAGKNDEAADSFRQALKVTQALVAEDPKNTEYKRDLHITLGRLADSLYASGKQQEARRATEQALQVLRPMVDAPGASDYEIYEYCWVLLTTPFRDLRAPGRALRYAEQLVQATAGKDPNTLDLLARAYEAILDFPRAVETELKALALLPPESVSDLRTELETNLARFRARAETKR
jgi:non-specific serine/threonine protein kinase/serine/threonine-protein kinase